MRRSQPALIEPSRQQLLARLDSDIAWLKQRRLWSRTFFERAISRYISNTRSTDGLEAFVARHTAPQATQVAEGRRTNKPTSSPPWPLEAAAARIV